MDSPTPIISRTNVEIRRIYEQYKRRDFVVKSYQRLLTFLAAIEASTSRGTLSQHELEHLTSKIYLGVAEDIENFPGIIKLAINNECDQLSGLANTFGITIHDGNHHISMGDLVNPTMNGATLWRMYRDTIKNEIMNVILPTWYDQHNVDGSIPSGKNIHDMVLQTLQALWEKDNSSSAKTYVQGEYIQLSFLTFLACGPPAGQYCWNGFSGKKQDGSDTKDTSTPQKKNQEKKGINDFEHGRAAHKKHKFSHDDINTQLSDCLKYLTAKETLS